MWRERRGWLLPAADTGPLTRELLEEQSNDVVVPGVCGSAKRGVTRSRFGDAEVGLLLEEELNDLAAVACRPDERVLQQTIRF